MKLRATIRQDAFGWYLIWYRGATLQAFRTEAECRQWLADVRLLNHLHN